MMTKSTLKDALANRLDSDRAWYLRDLPPPHRNALESICQKLGLKPLKPRDVITYCPECNDETYLVRMGATLAMCLGCPHGSGGADLIAEMAAKGKPPPPKRRLADSFEMLHPSENARDLTAATAKTGIIEEGAAPDDL